MSGDAAAFADRHDAGRALARRLVPRYGGRTDVLVLALPRGGVPVGYEVARALKAPLDVLLVRKLGVPGQEELAMGAIASGGARVLNTEVLETLGIPRATVEQVAATEERELARRARAFRGDRPEPDVEGRTVIVVDDGLATGSSARAALSVLRQRGPRRLVLAAPVGSPGTCTALAAEADEVLCAVTPEHFRAVGLAYDDFAQTTDEEVRELLARSREERAPGAAS
jgi:predicted phosphoribosyltransferase